MTTEGQLKDEHEGILLMLKILDKVSGKMKKQGETNLGHLEQMVGFFNIFVDRCHHGKEEDLLLPEMEKAGIPGDRGPVGVMLAEPVQGRAYGRSMGEGVEALTGGVGRRKGNSSKRPGLMSLFRPSPSTRKIPLFSPWETESWGGTREKFHKLLHQLRHRFRPLGSSGKTLS